MNTQVHLNISDPSINSRNCEAVDIYKAAKDPIYCYDLHATILHQMGIDHKRLTYRHDGIDRRLTDVHGNVLSSVI